MPTLSTLQRSQGGRGTYPLCDSLSSGNNPFRRFGHLTRLVNLVLLVLALLGSLLVLLPVLVLLVVLPP